MTTDVQVELPEAFGFLFDPPLGAVRYRVAHGGRGSAKCLALGTRIVMADGSLRAIEDVRVGESVLGPDSAPRRVLGTSRGRGPLFRVHQTTGMDYVVNGDHVLTLKKAASATRDTRPMPSGNLRNPRGRYPDWPEVVNIGVSDYLNQSTRWRSNFRGFRAGCLRFAERPVLVDPYLLGVWLGDGHSRELRITTADQEVVEACASVARPFGGEPSFDSASRGKARTFGLFATPGNRNPIWSGIKAYGIAAPRGAGRTRKRVPEDYLVNSEAVRLELLAGLIDSDGHYRGHGYTIVQVSEPLARDIKRLADGLGFRTGVSTYATSFNGKRGTAYRVSINGDVWRIPCRVTRKRARREEIRKNKDWLVSQVTVTPAGEGDWAGIAIDGDHLFLLEDGTVTHNSWQFARALLLHGAQRKLRILCAREYQNSLADSVHTLLVEQADAIGLGDFYDHQHNAVTGANGTEFLFKGLRRDPKGIKSLEGVDICWVEEAEAVSRPSLDILIPTVRKPGSELWFSFNPGEPDDPIYQMFVADPVDRALVRRVSYRDNPWLPQVLVDEAKELQRRDPDAYAHVWGGEPVTRSDAQVFAGRYRVEEFVPQSSWSGPYFGADWGFARDPAVLVKLWIADSVLYVEHEEGGVQLNHDQLETRWRRIPGAEKHAIRADSARPETIHEMQRRGFRVEAAPKWSGSVEDGIEHLRTYHAIVVHPRCKRAIEEFRLYRYKTDKRTGDVLPDLVDAHNHVIDAIRYALAPLIRQREFKTTKIRYA